LACEAVRHVKALGFLPSSWFARKVKKKKKTIIISSIAQNIMIDLLERV
jgi:hypothetical protein